MLTIIRQTKPPFSSRVVLRNTLVPINCKKQIEAGNSNAEIKESWQPALEKFKKIRAKYLLIRN